LVESESLFLSPESVFWLPSLFLDLDDFLDFFELELFGFVVSVSPAGGSSAALATVQAVGRRTARARDAIRTRFMAAPWKWKMGKWVELPTYSRSVREQYGDLPLVSGARVD
jgi:hypothetical protein